jgi:hypothetical protein
MAKAAAGVNDSLSVKVELRTMQLLLGVLCLLWSKWFTSCSKRPQVNCSSSRLYRPTEDWQTVGQTQPTLKQLEYNKLYKIDREEFIPSSVETQAWLRNSQGTTRSSSMTTQALSGSEIVALKATRQLQ